MRTATADRTATAECDDGDVAVGGGFSTDNGSMRDSFPVGTPPDGWTATTTANQPITAFVVCVTQ
ncbi:hypothetical protein JCM4814A_90480 [Streptomyces phaeofaciens JCM 4814]|uniref:Uncharacterized protein n=1 Tax=Streptomyces phaeofaciens TaxID=68254 RepID=A0A918HBX8_9ACTN|nr:hypothetical protein [Streptomyces phaeofaciens]GGT51672.1 hypothetical protein GCM10010226_31050 [Streptomyces phaeofaciens]